MQMASQSRSLQRRHSKSIYPGGVDSEGNSCLRTCVTRHRTRYHNKQQGLHLHWNFIMDIKFHDNFLWKQIRCSFFFLFIHSLLFFVKIILFKFIDALIVLLNYFQINISINRTIISSRMSECRLCSLNVTKYRPKFLISFPVYFCL